MGTKPTLAIDIYQANVGIDGAVHWPDSPNDRGQLARVLYGRQLIGTLDYWLDYAIDLIEKAAPTGKTIRKTSRFNREEQSLRDGLATLSPNQKQAVRLLLQTIIRGALFSSLVDIDQGDYGDFVLGLIPRSAEIGSLPVQIAPMGYQELHDELSDWILSFSKYGGELVELVEIKDGWQIQNKPFPLE